MRQCATVTLRGQRESPDRRSCACSKINCSIDPGIYREGTSRIGTDPYRQTGERHLNIGAKTIVRNNRKAYRRADATLRNAYGTGANRNREIRRLWLLNDGSCTSTTSRTNSTNQNNEDSARYTVNEPSQGNRSHKQGGKGRFQGTRRTITIFTLFIYLINRQA
jgi:hypothetical protein